MTLYNSSRTVLISILHGKTGTCGSENHKRSAIVIEGLNLTQESDAAYLSVSEASCYCHFWSWNKIQQQQLRIYNVVRVFNPT